MALFGALRNSGRAICARLIESRLLNNTNIVHRKFTPLSIANSSAAAFSSPIRFFAPKTAQTQHTASVPKRPAGPFSLFYKDVFPSIKVMRASGAIDIAETMRGAAVRWQNMSDADKARYVLAHEKARAAYMEQVTQMPEEMREEISRQRSEKVKVNKKKRSKKVLRSLGIPTRPPTPLMLYVKEQYASGAVRKPTDLAEGASRTKELCASFKQLSTAQRSGLQQRYDAARARYDNDLVEFVKQNASNEDAVAALRASPALRRVLRAVAGPLPRKKRVSKKKKAAKA